MGTHMAMEPTLPPPPPLLLQVEQVSLRQKMRAEERWENHEQSIWHCIKSVSLDTCRVQPNGVSFPAPTRQPVADNHAADETACLFSWFSGAGRQHSALAQRTMALHRHDSEKTSTATHGASSRLRCLRRERERRRRLQKP
jgi:hypothetical protein